MDNLRGGLAAIGVGKGDMVGIIANNRVVFNIKANDYRLVVAFAYRTQRGFIKFIGTHAQYDEVDAATVEPE